MDWSKAIAEAVKYSADAHLEAEKYQANTSIVCVLTIAFGLPVLFLGAVLVHSMGEKRGWWDR